MNVLGEGTSRNMKKRKKSRRRRKPAAELEATYICDSCGEEIVVPVDISGGAHQDYVCLLYTSDAADE